MTSPPRATVPRVATYPGAVHVAHSPPGAFIQPSKETDMPFTPHVGKRCIIRTYASGVHFGTLSAQDGRQVELTDARRLWRWFAKDGISLSEVSQNGIVPSKSRIAQVVPAITILDALEIIPCSDAAIASIDSAKVSVP